MIFSLVQDFADMLAAMPDTHPCPPVEERQLRGVR